MIMKKLKRFALPIAFAVFAYGASHFNDMKRAYNTYFQKPYHEFISENEFIPDGTQFYDLSDYRQALLALCEGFNEEDIDTLREVTSIESKKDSVKSYLFRKKHMPIWIAEKYVNEISEDELNRLWKYHMKDIFSTTPENRILRVRFKCKGDDKIKHCDVELFTDTRVMDMNITFVKRNNKWVEYETK